MSVSLKIAEKQLDGGIDFTAFKRLAGTVAVVKEDMATFKLWCKAATNSRDVLHDDEVFLVFADAFVGMERLAACLSSGTPVDTRNPAFWLVMRDAVCGCNRLSVMPDVMYGADKMMIDMVRSTAFMLDVAGRLADPAIEQAERRELSGTLSSRDVFKRALSVMLDICVGRGGVWIAYIDAMGARAAKQSGADMSWLRMRNEYAAGRVQVLVEALAQRRGCEVLEAVEPFKDYANRIALCFDRWQLISMRTSMGISFNIVNRGRRFDAARCSEGFFEVDEAMDMIGYSRMFGVSAHAATTAMPVAVEVELRKKRIAAAQEEAIMRNKEKRDAIIAVIERLEA